MLTLISRRETLTILIIKCRGLISKILRLNCIVAIVLEVEYIMRSVWNDTSAVLQMFIAV